MGAMLVTPQSERQQPEVKPVASKSKSKVSKLKSGNVLKVIEDIQRLPNEAIYEEFDSLLAKTRLHLRNVKTPPCAGQHSQLLRCLENNRQQACKCFNLMEQYRHCVILATQQHIDDQAAANEPARMPMIPPKAVPSPELQREQRGRKWWKFWTWWR